MSAATEEMYKAAADVLNRRLAQHDGLFGVSRDMVDAALAAAPVSAEPQPNELPYICDACTTGHYTGLTKCECSPPDLAAENARLREALEWYGEQARLARLVHSEGDKGRHALAGDGGTRARAALTSRRVA